MLKTCDVQNVKWTLKASACSTCQQYQQKSCDCKWKWKKEKRRTQKSANKNDLCIYCHNVFNSKCSPSLILLFILQRWFSMAYIEIRLFFLRFFSFAFFFVFLSLSLAITEIVCRNLMKSSDWEPACLTKWYCSSWLIHLNIECSNGANRIKLNWLKYLSVHYTKRLEIVFHCIWLWNEKFST